jgi:hypothetical protein
MPVLSAANAIQAKTGTQAASTTAAVTLDNPTTPGGTVTVELYGPISWPGMPAGWEFDATAGFQVWMFRYSGGPGGETSWTFSFTFPIDWIWRVTEWDATLDPVSPLDAQPGTNTAGGSGVATMSTGTTSTNVRAETVALAMHMWRFAPAQARTVSFGGHTNGFVERDENRWSTGAAEIDACWSWLFNDTAGTFECTATVSNSAPNASDTYYGLVVVYAADQPVMVDSPLEAMSSGGGQP